MKKLFSGVALVFLPKKHFPNWCHMQSDSIKATAIDNPLQFYVKFFIKICVKHNTTNGWPADPRKIQIIEWMHYNDFKLFYKLFFSLLVLSMLFCFCSTQMKILFLRAMVPSAIAIGQQIDKEQMHLNDYKYFRK